MLPLLFAGFFTIIAIAAYLLGSINFAIIISNRQFHEDIRSFGSKNAGATNMMRTYGKKAAALTFAGDALKAAVAAIIGYAIWGQMGAYVAGLFCVLGHMFPIYYRFRGGKGVVTTAISVLMCSPFVFLCCITIFLIIAIGTKYVSLASVMSAFFYPILLYKLPAPFGAAGTAFPLFALLIMLLIVLKHRENLVRLWQGKENKFSFGKKDKKKAEDAKENGDKEAHE
ncbi:MAG: glycerol-3-phosphate 1-O-acyltransferase PlsY [Clostridia bacterium]|nr:glycerol-3-phosphate 1-O-acyltransferase PlsY [Clostridia bacterium]